MCTLITHRGHPSYVIRTSVKLLACSLQCTSLFLPHFDVISALVEYTCMAKWNLDKFWAVSNNAEFVWSCRLRLYNKVEVNDIGWCWIGVTESLLVVCKIFPCIFFSKNKKIAGIITFFISGIRIVYTIKMFQLEGCLIASWNVIYEMECSRHDT